MIEGYVSEALEPIVEIGLIEGNVVTTIPAIVDTGFSGYLCLSDRYAGQIEGEPFVSSGWCESK
jgi:predicted aspartyl protease